MGLIPTDLPALNNQESALEFQQGVTAAQECLRAVRDVRYVH